MAYENSDLVGDFDHSSGKEIDLPTFLAKDNNNTLKRTNASDSAYDSLQFSSFTPIIISNSNQSQISDYQDNLTSTQDSISPFLENSETDDVFQISLDEIYTDSKPTNSVNNAVFRPISSGREFIDNSSCLPYLNETNPRSNLVFRHNILSNYTKTHRSISTQTKFSIGSIGFYRPNSAPLQEGIEEELSEIETSAMESSTYQIPRNSTCLSIRSPIPDLIQPAFHRDNQILVSRLSLIADQINQDLFSQRNRNARRFSTPLLSQINSGGSFFDLLFSIYNAFDNRFTRRRSATYSYNYNESSYPR